VELGSGAVRHYLADALGSVTALADENGAVKTTYSYDPFGQVAAGGEASDNPFQYTGRENDGTGLYYYRARYYSPELQRFISEDPIGLAGGVNYYAYAGNSPLSHVDPVGLEGEKILAPPRVIEHPSFKEYKECTERVNVEECSEVLKDCLGDCKAIPDACSKGEHLKDTDPKGTEPLQGICGVGCYCEYIGCLLLKTPGTINCELQNPGLDLLIGPPVGNPEYRLP
jgi:RHS repeat-associated protein